MKDKIAKWYKFKLWNSKMVYDAVEGNILTIEDFNEITGIDY